MDTLPMFSGFPQAGLEVLANLAVHNERVWFEAHKQDYQALLLEPVQIFVMTLGVKLQALSKLDEDIKQHFHTDPPLARGTAVSH
jgi:uncharacterized protein (DUF2461 family)